MESFLHTLIQILRFKGYIDMHPEVSSFKRAEIY